MSKPSQAEPTFEDQFQTQLTHWRIHPDVFAREVFGFKASNQQLSFLKELGKLVAAKMKRDQNIQTTVEEEAYIAKRGISVRSGKGCGKDAVAAIIAFWFLFCFPQSKTYLLAPSMDNLKTNLVAEMSLWRSRKIQGEPTCLIKDELDLMTGGCRLTNDENHGKHWFVTCNSAGPHMPVDQQIEVLQGKHTRFMQFIIDEASGVPDAVFQPLDTTLTDPVNFIILLWNPTRRSGFAYQTHFDSNEKKHWVNLHWNSEESDMITPDQITYLRTKYGVDSNQYRVSVLGEPPSIDDGSLIPYEWCTDAKELELTPHPKDPIIMGVDVARMGVDSSVILVRSGPQIIELTELNQLDTVQLARWVAMRAGDHLPQAIYVDAVGLGIGVVDELNRMGVANVYAVNVSRAAQNPRKFCLLRDELWWTLREKFERHGLSLAHLPDVTDLISELSSVKYDVKDNGKIKVESKHDMRLRHVPSPNKADALMLTMMSNDADYYGTEDEDKELDSDHRRHVQSYRKLSWLEV